MSAIYCYVKAQPSTTKEGLIATISIQQLFRKTAPLFITGGLFLLLLTIYPFISYRFLVFSKNQRRIISPIADISVAEAQGFINPLISSKSIAVAKEEDNVVVTEGLDLEQINNWFPSASLPSPRESKITHYTLSIPKLDIGDAIVEIGGGEIKSKLIHYPGTALPGEYGNSVVFGHSVLPIFYNPKDYKTIFSTIPTLEKGDKIYLDFDGIQFVYQVEKYFEVNPEEIEVLQQKFDEQVLSLITCVPPGTYQKRGIIKARLIRE